MKTIKENDLIFDVTSALKAEKFDDITIHGTKSTMKKVDFIIEETNRVIFLEVKDPDMPGAKNAEKLNQDLKSKDLIYDLAGKFRDSLLFTHLRGKYNKPVHYVVLIGLERLEHALILSSIDSLKSAIPISNKHWSQDSANSCIILKLSSYKQAFGEKSVWRDSEFKA